MSETNQRNAAIEELSENIACRLTSSLLKRCGLGLFKTENDSELPDLKNFLNKIINEELLQSEFQLQEDWQNYLTWKNNKGE